jgi:hypothetical protein
MALTAAHPGVTRWKGALWLVHPDHVDGVDLNGPRPRTRSGPMAYIVTFAVFGAVIALDVWVPFGVKKQLAGWVPGADVESGFTGLTVVIAIALLATTAWIAYRKTDVFASGGPGTEKVVSADVFDSASVSVTNDMSWRTVWELGSALTRLEASSLAAFEASKRDDAEAAEGHRDTIRTELRRAERAAEKLGLEPDLSFYRYGL